MKTHDENWQKAGRKNTLNLALWTGAWVASMAIVTFGPKYIWNENATITLIGILINLAIGIGVILANKRHLHTLDELQRKIQLEAMGITLGVAVIFGLSYSLLDTSNLIAYDAEISHLVILIGLTYLGGTIIGNSRYR